LGKKRLRNWKGKRNEKEKIEGMEKVEERGRKGKIEGMEK
jgi:hypothetical protein